MHFTAFFCHTGASSVLCSALNSVLFVAKRCKAAKCREVQSSTQRNAELDVEHCKLTSVWCSTWSFTRCHASPIVKTLSSCGLHPTCWSPTQWHCPIIVRCPRGFHMGSVRYIACSFSHSDACPIVSARDVHAWPCSISHLVLLTGSPPSSNISHFFSIHQRRCNSWILPWLCWLPQQQLPRVMISSPGKSFKCSRSKTPSYSNFQLHLSTKLCNVQRKQETTNNFFLCFLSIIFSLICRRNFNNKRKSIKSYQEQSQLIWELETTIASLCPHPDLGDKSGNIWFYDKYWYFLFRTEF